MDDKHALVEELATRHGENLRRFLRSRVRNAADIPDVIQEVYLRLLRVPNHETIRAPEAYIFTVAHHVAQQHTLRTATEVMSAQLGDVLSELRSVTEMDPALEVIAQECVEVLDRALLQLPPKAQATFLLYRRDGKSMDEISEQLGISRFMAKKYLVKVLVHLRKLLKDAE
jgi:RNA polymerase sigma factor (sigma-70 family)